MSDDGGDDKYTTYHLSPNNRVYLPAFLSSYDIDTYEPTEPIYDDFEPQSPGEPEANNAATDDPDALEHGQNVVEVGKDASAMGGGAAKTTSRDKKIPKEKRNTTPYMTKYERARVLGTRALQIRWASCMWWILSSMLTKMVKFECAGAGGYGRRNRSVADCDQRAEGEENSLGCEAISTGWLVRYIDYPILGGVFKLTVLCFQVRRLDLRGAALSSRHLK